MTKYNRCAIMKLINDIGIIAMTNQMVRYSSSYANCSHGFSIQNLPNESDDRPYLGEICVLKNIIQRGKDTPLSSYLRAEFGVENVDSKPYYLLGDQPQNWYVRIKGNDDEGDYPAVDFFEEQFPNVLPEYEFVRQLIIPEASIEKIGVTKGGFKDECVDFYLPQAKLVIEIDGSQHLAEVQAEHDKKRDEALRAIGCHVVRITAKAVKRGLTAEDECVAELRKVLEESDDIRRIKEAQDNCGQLDYSVRVALDEVMRCQMLLLTLLERGSIKLTDSAWYFDVDGVDFDRLRIAAEDLFIWLDNLLAIQNKHIEFPVVMERKEGERICIDFSMLDRWCDNPPKGKITVRTDYWDYTDYYTVSVSDKLINYNITEPIELKVSMGLHFVLKELFGYDEFREGQLPIIVGLLNLKDTVGILPTGSGKSLCYQFCCMLQPAVSFVVSPLISLQIDQKRNLDNFGITHTNFISSIVSAWERSRINAEFGKRKYHIVWISPERFQSVKFRDEIAVINKQSNFAYAVIDEVHCLSEWGHDFRTSYLTLVKTIRSMCPQAVLGGLTATASQFVLLDVKKEFGCDSSAVKAVGSMQRPELSFHIHTAESREEKALVLENLLTEIYEERPAEEDDPCGIVFTVFKGGKQGCEQLRNQFNGNLFSKKNKGFCNTYHGSLKNNEKSEVQEDFISGNCRCLFSTKAFGMGINKPDVRYTIHYGLPWSVESFYQEAGRAGRDKKKAECHIIYNPEQCDKIYISELFAQNTSANAIKIISEFHLNNDLGDLFFLWNQNHHGVEREISTARSVLSQLMKGNTVICSSVLRMAEAEKALYHLYLMGVVEDWVIEQWGEETALFKVTYNGFDLQRVRAHILAYIRKYDPLFMVDERVRNDIDKSYYGILNNQSEKEGTRYVRLLISWIYDNVVYSRRSMMRNMMQFCEDYTDGESFKKKMDMYLKISDKSVNLDNIAHSPFIWENWLDIFVEYELLPNGQVSEYHLSMDGCEELFRMTQRYTESYRNNMGIDFVLAIAGLRMGRATDGEKTDVFSRLEQVVGQFDFFDKQTQDTIFLKMAELLREIPTEDKRRIKEILYAAYPYSSLQLYRVWRDEGTMILMLETFKNYIHDVMEGITW